MKAGKRIVKQTCPLSELLFPRWVRLLEVIHRERFTRFTKKMLKCAEDTLVNK